ncbi:hypothetical protein BJ138DRAFT_1099675 [Hygrophoropsis aurantiaca]|uniref:Uncharacterized protein n=1 Tax=Hygrophoropsis aurantiaca TaxID=72124 RepID=A0ACB8AJW9_9AGAM|nr:hypothetical protein BJ138DRAFT_1099675 [Hygrophoropsis aurantiaca]
MFFPNIITGLLFAAATVGAIAPATSTWELYMYAGYNRNAGGKGILASNYWHGKIAKPAAGEDFRTGPCLHLENGMSKANSIEFTTKEDKHDSTTAIALVFFKDYQCLDPHMFWNEPWKIDGSWVVNNLTSFRGGKYTKAHSFQPIRTLKSLKSQM